MIQRIRSGMQELDSPVDVPLNRSLKTADASKPGLRSFLGPTWERLNARAIVDKPNSASRTRIALQEPIGFRPGIAAARHQPGVASEFPQVSSNNKDVPRHGCISEKLAGRRNMAPMQTFIDPMRGGRDRLSFLHTTSTNHMGGVRQDRNKS